MGRAGRVFAVLALVGAACGTAGTAPSSTTASPFTVATTTSSTATTTTDPAPTTTTTDPETPVDLVLQGLSSDPFVLNPGRLHFHTVGAIPIEIQFEEEGWDLRFIGERIIGFINERDDDVAVAGLVMVVSESLDDIRGRIEQFTDSAPMTAPEDTRFGGQPAMTFDVEIPVNTQVVRGACSAPSLGEERGVDEPGTGPASRAGLYEASPIGCSWNRVWVIPLVDGSIVALLGDEKQQQQSQREDRSAPTRPIEPLAPYFDEFEAAITLDF